MKFRLVSDLHLEFSNLVLCSTPDDKDCTLIIAGDICVGRKDHVYHKLLENLSKRFRYVIVVAGNHDYWYNSMIRVDDKIRGYCSAFDNIIYLQNDFVSIDNVLIVGSTLWSSITNPYDIYEATSRMVDYRHMRTGTASRPYLRKVKVSDTVIAHQKSVRSIEAILNKQRASHEKCMIVTHHAPSVKSIDRRYGSLHPAFATNLEYLMPKYDINIWCHGHIHLQNDYMIGDTRILANPRGYVSDTEVEFTNWDEAAVFEI